ncbi:MAG TPA: SDR family NAD(P)-dependent oxidoreductase [Ktedonobacterales bacterium]
MSAPQEQPKAPIAKLFDLTGKVALVTGAAMGIGAAIAARLAEAGASVMIGDVNEEAAKATAANLTAAGYKASATKANISQVADARAMVATTVAAYGRIDILVNNAGVFPFSPVLEMTEEQWDRVLDINLKGSFFAAQAAAAQMVESGRGGRIVNIASVDALHPTGMLAHYDSSKGGVVMMTKALAKELGPRGVRVNAIAPGSIMTPGAAAGSSGQTVSQEVMAQYMARMPIGRMGAPDDIATVALFLASDASAYMTGALVVVDGGYLLS